MWRSVRVGDDTAAVLAFSERIIRNLVRVDGITMHRRIGWWMKEIVDLSNRLVGRRSVVHVQGRIGSGNGGRAIRQELLDGVRALVARRSVMTIWIPRSRGRQHR